MDKTARSGNSGPASSDKLTGSMFSRNLRTWGRLPVLLHGHDHCHFLRAFFNQTVAGTQSA